MTAMVAPKPCLSATRLAMLGLGGCGVRKNQMAEAKFSQDSATSCGRSSSVLSVPNMARENWP
jgi:hypothetical protein